TARAPSVNAATGLFLPPSFWSGPPAPFPLGPFVPFPSGMLIPQRFSDPDDSAGIVKFRALAFGPPVNAAQIHLDLPFGRQFDVCAIHGTRRGPLEVDAFGIVARAVTR